MTATIGVAEEKVDKTTTKPEKRKHFVTINSKPNSNTTIILFGWAGCRYRYLSKYAVYYEKAGYSTICYTVPIHLIRSFSSYDGFAKYFYKVVFEDEKIALPENVYFHAFSMNGCSVLTMFWDLLDTVPEGPSIKSKVKGMIFDRYHAAFRESYRAVLYTFFSINRSVLWLKSFVSKDVWQKNFAYFRMFDIQDLPKRQLYMYGPGDEVCSAESIEAFAEDQKNKGVTTVMHRMEDSLHCQHLRKYPEEYEKACLKFVEHDANDNAIEVVVARIPSIAVSPIEKNDETVQSQTTEVSAN